MFLETEAHGAALEVAVVGFGCVFLVGHLMPAMGGD